MTRTVTVMDAPDPDTCTHEEWEAYVASTDLDALTLEELDARRVLRERYVARMWREHDEARAAITRRLDARDQANADADALSERCAALHQQLIDAGDVVLAARREHGFDSEAARDALKAEAVASEALSQARAELAAANLRAIQATLDAQ